MRTYRPLRGADAGDVGRQASSPSSGMHLRLRRGADDGVVHERHGGRGRRPARRATCAAADQTVSNDSSAVASVAQRVVADDRRGAGAVVSASSVARSGLRSPRAAAGAAARRWSPRRRPSSRPACRAAPPGDRHLPLLGQLVQRLVPIGVGDAGPREQRLEHRRDARELQQLGRLERADEVVDARAGCSARPACPRPAPASSTARAGGSSRRARSRGSSRSGASAPTARRRPPRASGRSWRRGRLRAARAGARRRRARASSASVSARGRASSSSTRVACRPARGSGDLSIRPSSSRSTTLCHWCTHSASSHVVLVRRVALVERRRPLLRPRR